MKYPLRTLVALLLAAGAASPAFAADHAPAVMSRPQAGIDASTFIVGHPASPRWKAAPSANGHHPAVLVARQAAHIDANTFLVQPPASTTWALRPAGEVAVVAGSPAVNAR